MNGAGRRRVQTRLSPRLSAWCSSNRKPSEAPHAPFIVDWAACGSFRSYCLPCLQLPTSTQRHIWAVAVRSELTIDVSRHVRRIGRISNALNSMNGRKSHTKSRKGCIPCKSRRVKCDESRPHCSNCSRLDLPCTWTWPPSAAPSPPVAAPANNDATPSRTAELVLLHHWTLHTATTLSPGACELRLWQDILVRLSFQHHFLLDGILAVAAIHRAVANPSDAEALSVQSSQHIESAIKSFRHHLDHPDDATLIPLFALSSLLVIHSFAVAQIQLPHDPIAALCFMAKLIKGVGQTVWRDWSLLQRSEVAPLLIVVESGSGAAKDVPEILRLRQLVMKLPDIDWSLRETYTQAIDGLHDVFRTTKYPKGAGRSPLAITLNWPGKVPLEFLDLLADKEPIPLVILAHFSILLRLHEDSWYMHKWAGWIFARVELELASEYRELIDWPRQMLHDPDLWATFYQDED